MSFQISVCAETFYSELQLPEHLLLSEAASLSLLSFKDLSLYYLKLTTPFCLLCKLLCPG